MRLRPPGSLLAHVQHASSRSVSAARNESNTRRVTDPWRRIGHSACPGTVGPVLLWWFRALEPRGQAPWRPAATPVRRGRIVATRRDEVL